MPWAALVRGCTVCMSLLWDGITQALCCVALHRRIKKAMPHIQCWTDSLMLPTLNQTSHHPTEVIVWITAEPGQEPGYSLDVHTFCLNVPRLAWSSAFLGTEVQAIIKEPSLRTEQWPWHLSGYKESQEHQGLIAEWWLNSLRLGVGTAILPVKWKNLLLPAWPV